MKRELETELFDFARLQKIFNEPQRNEQPISTHLSPDPKIS
jgi:hypothetical protein